MTAFRSSRARSTMSCILWILACCSLCGSAKRKFGIKKQITVIMYTKSFQQLCKFVYQHATKYICELITLFERSRFVVEPSKAKSFFFIICTLFPRQCSQQSLQYNDEARYCLFRSRFGFCLCTPPICWLHCRHFVDCLVHEVQGCRRRWRSRWCLCCRNFRTGKGN